MHTKSIFSSSWFVELSFACGENSNCFMLHFSSSHLSMCPEKQSSPPHTQSESQETKSIRSSIIFHSAQNTQEFDRETLPPTFFTSLEQFFLLQRILTIKIPLFCLCHILNSLLSVVMATPFVHIIFDSPASAHFFRECSLPHTSSTVMMTMLNMREPLLIQEGNIPHSSV
jgi:hypothetical protein